VAVACTPGTDTGTAAVHVGAHTSGALWQGTLTDDRAGGRAVHRFYEVGKSRTGWGANYPVTGRGAVTLGSAQQWVAVDTTSVPYDCHP